MAVLPISGDGGRPGGGDAGDGLRAPVSAAARFVGALGPALARFLLLMEPEQAFRVSGACTRPSVATAMHDPELALYRYPSFARGSDVAPTAISLLRVLRTCTLATEAAEALLDALTAPALWGERPIGAWVQLGETALHGSGVVEPARAAAMAWARARMGPVLAARGPVGAPEQDGWSVVSAPKPEAGAAPGWPGTTLVWPVEELSGAAAGAVVLCFKGVRPPSGWGTPELGELMVSAAAPRLLSLPLRPAPTRPDRGPMLPVVGRAMAPLVDTLEAYARTEEILLLRGPTGTGKSQLARWCWSRSARSGRKLVVANLLGVPETGQDSELFGVRRGTFTGVGERLGQLQSAHHGTLFLDEVDKLTLSTQAKLLRVLDERRYYVVGDASEHTADVRFIIASNTDLEAAVAERRFLEDLYYRINVMPVCLPPLRERPDEIGPWAQHMATEIHAGRGGRRVTLTAEAELLLTEPRWPGNLRELHNVVRRAYAFATLEASPTERAGLPEHLEIQGVHVRRALRSGLAPEAASDGPAIEALQRAAVGLVNLAVQRRAAGQSPLQGRDGDLALADSFRGLVLQIAAERLGDPRAAFELFGIESRLRGGNHLRTWRLAHRQVELLRRALAEEER